MIGAGSPGETDESMTPEMIAILAVGAALTGLIWQGHRALRADLSSGLREARDDRERVRADLSSGLREAREDRERVRADLGARMGRIDDRMDRIDGRMNRIDDRLDRIDGRIDRIDGRMNDQGERLSRIEGMLHLHLGRNEDFAPPPAPAE